MISVIIPIFNEAETIPALFDKLSLELNKLGQDYEVIFINDGSSDNSENELESLIHDDCRYKLINLKVNAGQTAAMMAGIHYAQGDVIVPMDGDLQNDPADIKLLIDKLDEGYDVVSGWRQNRQDDLLSRKIPSVIANRLISFISGVKLHDYGCSLKAYRRDLIKNVKLYGEMHRFIPIYASWQGGRITEIPVRHYARQHGYSKYGLARTFRVLLDLIVVKFLADYATKPIHVFGGFGIFSILISFLSGLYALYLKFFEDVSFILTPLPLLTVMTFITGIISILMGLLAELIMRIYFETQDKSVYLVRDTVNIEQD